MGIYETLGVRRVINASGNLTALGGSIMEKETIEAMNDAAKSFVFMDELMNKAGRIIAEITGAEAAIVTSGTCSSLTLAIAACMTGKDLSRINRLPDTTGMKNEIVIQRLHRNPFDNCIKNSGATLVEVGNISSTSMWEMEAILNEKTAAIVYFVFDPQHGVLPLSEVIKIGKKQGIPIIVEAAAEIPPIENLKKFTSLGADLVLFSGGKQISGPNDSGILCGRRDLVEAAFLNSFLNYFGWYGIGRNMKISKEQIAGLVVALQRYVKKDHDTEMKKWINMTNYMFKELQNIPYVKVVINNKRRVHEPRPHCIPNVTVNLDERSLGITVSEILNNLRDGNPPIEVWGDPLFGRICLNPECLYNDEEKIVINRLKKLLIVKN